MDTAIETKFQKMGARVRVTVIPTFEPVARLRWTDPTESDRRRPVTVDIRRDTHGEFFDVRYRPDVELSVLDVKPTDRHLLLMAREPNDRGRAGSKSKFLCGHDERAWFVAAIPENAGAKDVQSAKDALKPAAVWAAIREYGIRPDRRDRRRTAAFVRQGEWFFIPRPRLTVNDKLILKNEPIRRGSGNPHICQFLHRTGGQQVMVCNRYPNGLSMEAYQALSQHERDAQSWRAMVRDARAYVKGAIRHPDHQTVWLSFWHEVVMNTETQSLAMRHVAFLD